MGSAIKAPSAAQSSDSRRPDLASRRRDCRPVTLGALLAVGEKFRVSAKMPRCLAREDFVPTPQTPLSIRAVGAGVFKGTLYQTNSALSSSDDFEIFNEKKVKSRRNDSRTLNNETKK